MQLGRLADLADPPGVMPPPGAYQQLTSVRLEIHRVIMPYQPAVFSGLRAVR